MEGWKTKKVKEIQKEITTGFACSKKHQTENGYVHLRTHNIDVDGNLNFDLKIKIDPDKVDQNKNILLKNDVIFNNTNSKELVGKTALVKRDYKYGFSNHLTRIRLNEDLIVPDYFVKYMVYLFGNRIFERMSKKWIGQAGINISMLKGVEVQFPSKAIQRDIVRKLNILFSEIDAALALIDENIEKAEALKLSVLDEELNKYETKTQKVKDISKEINPGFACSKKHQKLDGYVHLRTHNIDTSGNLNFDVLIRIDPSKVNDKKNRIRKNDVLFNNTNSKELVGKTALVDQDYDYGYSNHLTKITLDETQVIPEYFVSIMMALHSNQFFERLSKKWIGQAGINTKMLNDIEVELPLLETQQKIVDKLDVLFTETDGLIAEYQEKRANLEALKASLLNQAFTGRL